MMVSFLGLLMASSRFFFFNDTATTEIYPLSLHDALPICRRSRPRAPAGQPARSPGRAARGDRKSTRLNSSHGSISYAVFCLKKKERVKKLIRNAVVRSRGRRDCERGRDVVAIAHRYRVRHRFFFLNKPPPPDSPPFPPPPPSPI